MNDRDRFVKIARFERADDPFEFLQGIWIEAIERWQTEGLPREAHPIRAVFFDHDKIEYIPVLNLIRHGRPYFNPPYYTAIDPWFQREVLADEGETEVVRDEDGVVYRVSKRNRSALPQYLEYPVKDRKTWNAYKSRLDPHSSGPWPEGWDRIDLTRTLHSHDPQFHGKPWNDRDFPLGISSLSLLGLPRNMMGLENLSYALYEDRGLVVDMMDHMLYWNMEIMNRIFSAGISIDFCYLWEDIAYKSGPLFSPKIMRELMVPRWQIFTEFLRSNGVTMILVDCDGNISELLPLVLEGGCNTMLPFEVAADNDVIEIRKKYGKNLTIIGGIDKRALAKSKNAIDAEIDRVRPLLKEGGYFPTLDHYAPPDIPFENYMYYRIKLKSMGTAGR